MLEGNWILSGYDLSVTRNKKKARIKIQAVAKIQYPIKSHIG
jgi:hypothetical protein